MKHTKDIIKEVRWNRRKHKLLAIVLFLSGFLLNAYADHIALNNGLIN